MAEPHDPQWVRFKASPGESSLSGLGREAVPTVGVGSYECSGCGVPHVVIAAILYDLETDMVVSPAVAREIAAALLVAADRVNAGGVN